MGGASFGISGSSIKRIRSSKFTKALISSIVSLFSNLEERMSRKASVQSKNSSFVIATKSSVELSFITIENERLQISSSCGDNFFCFENIGVLEPIRISTKSLSFTGKGRREREKKNNSISFYNSIARQEKKKGKKKKPRFLPID